MSLYAKGLPGARVIAFDPNGVILVSQPSEGKISALVDENYDGVAEKNVTVVDGLNVPHGLAFRCTEVKPTGNPETTCQLYVAEKSVLAVFDYNAQYMKATNKKKLLDLPGGSIGLHSTRSLLFKGAPDQDTLLISVGSSCNVCSESDVQRASVIAYNVVTGKSEQYAKGLRNSVFMNLHPVTGAVWATEMGRDGLGDEIPPDEINIVEQSKNYGWPICYGQNIHDTAYDKNTYIRNPCMTPFEVPAKIDLPAHSAPLGIAFIPEEGWEESYWYNALVAYHGSWNRSTPTGYKIVRVKLDAQGQSAGIEDFITGWLKTDGTKIGRPADIKVMPGGTIYISDDSAGVVYKVINTVQK
jgi:glucose/arabinose dehydrogenase